MSKDPFTLWKLPEKTETTLLTGLKVRNSLTNGTLVSINNFKIACLNHFCSKGRFYSLKRKVSSHIQLWANSK